LPRQSPDEAFNSLIKEQPTSPIAGLAREAEEVPGKSKARAATWSVIPGLGQIYVGETANGITRLAVAVVGAVAVAVPAYIAARRGSDGWPLVAAGLGGLIVLSFDYTSSYEDAMRGVVEWNERTEDSFNRVHPEAP